MRSQGALGKTRQVTVMKLSRAEGENPSVDQPQDPRELLLTFRNPWYSMRLLQVVPILGVAAKPLRLSDSNREVVSHILAVRAIGGAGTLFGRCGCYRERGDRCFFWLFSRG